MPDNREKLLSEQSYRGEPRSAMGGGAVERLRWADPRATQPQGGSFMEQALSQGAEMDPGRMDATMRFPPMMAPQSVSGVVPASRERIVDWLNEMAMGRGFAVPQAPLPQQAEDLVMGARERGDVDRAGQGKRVLRSLNAPTDTERAVYLGQDMMRPMPSLTGPAVEMPEGIVAPPTDYTMGGLPIEAPPVMDEQALMALARLRGGE